IAVAVTGPATLTGAVRVSGCAGAPVTGVTGTGFTVTTPAAGCAGDTEIVISETLTQTGAIPGGGALVQTITGPTIGTSGPITATAPGGGALTAPFAVATPTGVAKACTGPGGVTTVTPGTLVTCTVTFTPAGGIVPGTVNISALTGGS